MNILFICNQNVHRSKTAEVIFKQKCHSRSAGLFNETPLTAEELVWADLIVVMEDCQRRVIANRFPAIYLQKKIVSLNIPDVYKFKDPELIFLLQSRMEEFM